MNRVGISAKIDPQSKTNLHELVAAGDFSSLSNAVDQIIALGLSAYTAQDSTESIVRRVLREELSQFVQDGTDEPELTQNDIRRILREELSRTSVQQAPTPPSNPKLDKLLSKTRR